jgi:hypothetical protein
MNQIIPWLNCGRVISSTHHDVKIILWEEEYKIIPNLSELIGHLVLNIQEL